MDLPTSAAALFAPIHKALRLASCELLAELGRLDADDPAAVRRTLHALELLLGAYEKHLQYEEEYVRPEAEGRLQGGGTAFDDHPAHARQIAELRALAAALATSHAEHRATCKRTLYLHLTTFVGESLVHMADEERVLAPLLERVFSSAELWAVHARIQAVVTPEERAYLGPFIGRALDPEEMRVAARMAGAGAAGPAGAVADTRPAGAASEGGAR